MYSGSAVWTRMIVRVTVTYSYSKRPFRGCHRIYLLSEYPAAAPNGEFIRSVVGLSPCHGAHLTRNPIRILAVSTACGTPCRAGRLPRRRRSGGRPVWGSRRWLSYCNVTVSCAGALLWIYMGRRSCGGCGCSLCGSDALCGDRLFGRLFGGRYAVGAFV